MSNVGSPTVRRPLAAKPSIYSRLSASPSVPRPAAGAAGIGSSSSSSVARGAANGGTASVTAARGASVSTTGPSSPSASPTLRGPSQRGKPPQTVGGASTSASSRKVGGGVQGQATGANNKSSSMASQFSSTGSPLLGQTQNNLGVSIIGGRGGVDESSSSFPKVAAAQRKHHEDPCLSGEGVTAGTSSVGLSSDGNINATRGFSQEAMGRGSPLFQPAAAGSSNGYTFSSQLTSKAPSVAGTTVPISSVVESSIAFDTENHIRNFNDELVRDNELMLQEIEELRDENDIMFDELHRLRTENALLKEQNAELLESVNGQNEAFVRLSSEVAREMTITESLRKTFDTLHANRFDNLFTKRSRAKHASLGRPPTTRENLQMAREALDESNRQINNIFEIVHSMSQVPNFMSNPKDVLVVDATMQVISLCKVINSMIVAEKMGGSGASPQGKETDARMDSNQKGKSVLEGMAGAIASITPRPSSKAPSTAPLPSAGSSQQSRGSQRQQEKQPQTARARVGSSGDGGGISGFFKRIGKSSTSSSSQKDQAVVEEVETLVTVLTARPGNSSGYTTTTTSGVPPNALQLPNEHIHMPVSAKEVDKRATLLQRIASVFRSHGGSTVTPSSSAAVSRTNSLAPQISSSSSKAKSTSGGGAATARGIPVASNYFSDKTLPARRIPSPPPATTTKKVSVSTTDAAISAASPGSPSSISNEKNTGGPTTNDMALIARIVSQNERFTRSETTAVAGAGADNDNDTQEWDECDDNHKSGETSEDNHQIMKASGGNRMLENEASGRATEAYIHKTEEKEEALDNGDDEVEATVAEDLLEEGEDATPVTLARRTRRPDSLRNLEMTAPQALGGGDGAETPLARHQQQRNFAANLRYSSINATPPLSGRSAQLNE